MLGGLLRLAAAFAVTLGLLAVAFRMLRRVQSGLGRAGRGVPLEVLQRAPLGPRQGVALVRVADRVLVVSVAEQGARLLTELTGPALEEALRPAPASPAEWPRLRLPWMGWPVPLRRILPPAALLLALPLFLLPPSAAAQGGVPTPGPARGATAAPATPKPQAAAPVPLPATAPAPARSPAAPGPALFGPAPPQVDIRVGEGKQALHLSGTVGLVVLMGVLTLLPALFLLMTSFTRILIVLHFLRSALGTQSAPPGQLLVALAVLLTGVVMNPVLQQTNRDALQPYFNGKIAQAEAYQRAVTPFREFMLANTRERDLALFTELSGTDGARSVEEVPTLTVVAAFVTSELRTAFQMGFALYLPFVVVDLIVASVLMSLGMFMLPPMMISLPFKLLLFVLADGWTLVVQNLVASFR